jgi:diguanylate cyclase (GGDEF)-like protein
LIIKKINLHKILFIILFIISFTLLFSLDDSKQYNNNINKNVKEAEMLYEIAALSDTLLLSEKIDYCLKAEEIAKINKNDELLLKILLLESELYQISSDIDNFAWTIQKYISLEKKMMNSALLKDKKQISNQIIIRNGFMIGFILILNIALIAFIRYRVKNRERNKLEKANIQLEEISRKDPLTSLSNRRDIIEKINYEIIRFERNKRHFSLVMGDIDDFKSINDNFGHDCGDYVLKELSKVIISILRKQDIVSRWGGEEFLLLLPETNSSGAKIAAEKVRKIIEDKVFNYNSKSMPITITFGVSEYSITKDIDSCIKEADTALYRGKKRGKNRVEIFDGKTIKIG